MLVTKFTSLRCVPIPSNTTWPPGRQKSNAVCRAAALPLASITTSYPRPATRKPSATASDDPALRVAEAPSFRMISRRWSLTSAASTSRAPIRRAVDTASAPIVPAPTIASRKNGGGEIIRNKCTMLASGSARIACSAVRESGTSWTWVEGNATYSANVPGVVPSPSNLTIHTDSARPICKRRSDRSSPVGLPRLAVHLDVVQPIRGREPAVDAAKRCAPEIPKCRSRTPQRPRLQFLLPPSAVQGGDAVPVQPCRERYRPKLASPEV